LFGEHLWPLPLLSVVAFLLTEFFSPNTKFWAKIFTFWGEFAGEIEIFSIITFCPTSWPHNAVAAGQHNGSLYTDQTNVT